MRFSGWITRFATYAMIVFATWAARADWQIVVSNVVAGAVMPATNLVIRKLAMRAMREDISSEVSMLALLDKQEQVQLNHLERTYVRHSAQEMAALSPAVLPPSAAPEKTVFAERPAVAYRWTNGPMSGCSWVGLAAPFIRESLSLPGAAFAPTSAIPSLAVGSMLGTNSIVVGMEMRTVLPHPALLSGASPEAVVTNLVITMRSTLWSVTETNFNPSEFEIPSDYRDVTGQPEKPFQLNPAMFGREAVGRDNMEGLRKEFEKGRPVLQVPKIKIVN